MAVKKQKNKDDNLMQEDVIDDKIEETLEQEIISSENVLEEELKEDDLKGSISDNKKFKKWKLVLIFLVFGSFLFTIPEQNGGPS